MFATLPVRLLLGVAISVLGPATSALAGWVTYKNETKSTVLVQEVVANPMGKRAKPVRLLPGEVYREYHAKGGEKTIQILEVRKPTTVLCEAKVKWPAEDVAVRIKSDNKSTHIEPTPATKLGAPLAVVSMPSKIQ